MILAFALAWGMWWQQPQPIVVGGQCWHESVIQIATTSNGIDVSCFNEECTSSVCRLPMVGVWVKLPTTPAPDQQPFTMNDEFGEHVNCLQHSYVDGAVIHCDGYTRAIQFVPIDWPPWGHKPQP